MDKINLMVHCMLECVLRNTSGLSLYDKTIITIIFGREQSSYINSIDVFCVILILNWHSVPNIQQPIFFFSIGTFTIIFDTERNGFIYNLTGWETICPKSYVRQKRAYQTGMCLAPSHCTKSKNFNVSCLVLQLSLSNPLKPGVKSRMKMQLE